MGLCCPHFSLIHVQLHEEFVKLYDEGIHVFVS